MPELPPLALSSVEFPLVYLCTVAHALIFNVGIPLGLLVFQIIRPVRKLRHLQGILCRLIAAVKGFLTRHTQAADVKL